MARPTAVMSRAYREKVRRLTGEGWCRDAIGAEVGLDTRSVTRIWREMGVVRDAHRPRLKIDGASLLADRRAGMLLKQLAFKYGISTEAVFQRCREAGLSGPLYDRRRSLNRLHPSTQTAGPVDSCQAVGSAASPDAHRSFAPLVAPDNGDGGFRDGGKATQDRGKDFRGRHA